MIKTDPKHQNRNTITETRPVVSSRPQGRFEQLLSMLPFGVGGAKPVVAVFRLEGVIGKVNAMKSGLTLSALNKLNENMFKIDRLEAICLSINSPGGSPVSS